MLERIRTVFAAAFAVAITCSAIGVAPVAAVAPKVVIIVGPTGSQTDSYRSTGNSIADAATAAGAEVVKVYSPRATWARVRNAVVDANIIVYLGHGNGSPSPYSNTEYTDRVNGWGLNRTTKNGDKDDWSRTMVYCGEKALLGTLTSSDGAAQWRWCGGSNGTQGISPAANFVMIYNKACYTPGASEGWDTKATESQAFQRVRNYSYPVLAQGAGAYFATDTYQGAETLVGLILGNPDMPFAQIAMNGSGYVADAQVHFEHPDLGGSEVWIQRTGGWDGKDYWYAYAGVPNLTPAGNLVDLPPAPQKVRKAPGYGVTVAPDFRVRVWFDMEVEGVGTTTFYLKSSTGKKVGALVRWMPSRLRATIVPKNPLEPGRYVAYLTGGIHSAEGMALDSYKWAFFVAEPT